jgi:hypothetical protein
MSIVQSFFESIRNENIDKINQLLKEHEKNELNVEFGNVSE